MRIHYIQHVPFENLGSLEELFIKDGHALSVTKMYDEPEMPSIDAFDCLVIMGGPMGIFDEPIYPWLGKEKHFIKAAIDAQKVVLGICLGAQLIAHVLGAPVYRNTHKEIGWFDLFPSSEVQGTALDQVFRSRMNVFHWHGDTFDIPEGAVAIGYSQACANQGFIYDDRIIALQFHLETTPESLESLLAYCESDIDESEFVQSAAEIQAAEDKCATLYERAEILSKILPSLL